MQGPRRHYNNPWHVLQSQPGARVNSNQLTSSFRDPSGFLFEKDGKVMRQVNTVYQENYDQLMNSGLYESLVSKNLLIPHSETPGEGDCYRILEPEQLRYISYPYEWSFSQLKDAALLTMDIQIEALKHDMSLKDASAYNVQFHKGRRVFIDTLSFEKYQEGKPWVAYRQFCQHFLGPLALIAHQDYRLLRLSRSFIDGVPLDLASRLLPRRTWFSYGLLAHIHLHAKAQQKYQDAGRSQDAKTQAKIGRAQLQGLMESLRNTTSSLSWKYSITEWGDYYEDTNYVDESMKNKETLVARFLAEHKPGGNPIAADFGANTGKFSRLAVKQGYFVVAHDIDEVAVDKNYRETLENNEQSVLPLIQDLTNPSPSIGWANKERMSFGERHDIDVGMALAIIHHIAITNNVPLASVAEFFSGLCKKLIIEFVPKSDSQVRRLLATREDVFPDYNEAGFEQAFGQYFKIMAAEKLGGSERTLYLLERK
jgi:ribosomal protein L11 methylase PrmA